MKVFFADDANHNANSKSFKVLQQSNSALVPHHILAAATSIPLYNVDDLQMGWLQLISIDTQIIATPWRRKKHVLMPLKT